MGYVDKTDRMAESYGINPRASSEQRILLFSCHKIFYTTEAIWSKMTNL
jgi:hypothetical protein